MFCSLIASARTTVPPTLLRATYLMLPDVACEYGSLITERFTLSTIVYALEKSPKADLKVLVENLREEYNDEIR